MHTKSGFPVIFGETLYDCFPDGTKVLGGAPFNVAWHLQGFGLSPELVTALGSDSEGDQVFAMMEKWGMSTHRIATLENFSTGSVQVTLNNASPSYMIELEQAFDFIPPCDTCVGGLLYFGTLALRSEVSRNSLIGLRESAEKIFVDVNIRHPWFNAAYLPSAIMGCDWFKSSDVELSELTGLPATTTDEVIVATKKLRSRYDIKNFLITAGSKGAWLITAKQELFESAIPVEGFVDSVGAGDAFSAMTIFGIYNNWSSVDILHRSLQFASKICGIRGATIDDKSMYKKTFSS